jgi:phosphoribosylglycinamide formyltransferase 2
MAAQRLGFRVVVVDPRDGAPAMQVAHASEVAPLDDAAALEGVIRTHEPAVVLPLTHRMHLERLERLQADGVLVVPSVGVLRTVADRGAIRDLASGLASVRAPSHRVVDSREALGRACDDVGFPCVVKPIATHLTRGMSVVSGPARVETAWDFAVEEPEPRDGTRVIVEEFVEFESELTLLTAVDLEGTIHMAEPIGHRQEQGAYRESWMPADLPDDVLSEARRGAEDVVRKVGGPGLFAVEFFLAEKGPLFSEVSIGPHPTGFLTLASQDLSQFELHLRAVLGLPIPGIRFHGPTAAAGILGGGSGRVRSWEGRARALSVTTSAVHLFSAPGGVTDDLAGVALAGGADIDEARARALEAASRVEVRLER